MTPEIRETVERLVKERIEEIAGRIRTSSIEISRTSTGKPGFSVKVYDPDPYKAANRAREIESRLAEEFGMGERAKNGNLFKTSESEPPTAPAPEPSTPPSDGMDGWDN